MEKKLNPILRQGKHTKSLEYLVMPESKEMLQK